MTTQRTTGRRKQAAAAAKIPHVVTVSHFTQNDAFPSAVCVVADLGEPGRPAELRSGQDVRDGRGVIGFESLLRIAKDGSQRDVLADDLASPSHIAVDARAVYVVSRDQAKIVRFAKR